MRKYILPLLLTLIVSSNAYSGDGNPFAAKIATDEQSSQYSSLDTIQKKDQKLSWAEKQRMNITILEKKNFAQQKYMANAYKRVKDQEEWNKNYTLQRFVEVAKKVEEVGNTVSSYGEQLILQTDGSYIRYYDGRPTDIFNLAEKDNYGNVHYISYLNMMYESSDNFATNEMTTMTHLLRYIKLDYDPLGAIQYLNFNEATYNSNVSDRPSEYTTTEGAVIKTSAMELTTPTSTGSAKNLYDRLIDNILPSVESALSYTITTTFSNIKYYTLAEDNATSNKAGGVYGEKKSYDYTLVSTSAPQAPESGNVSNIKYYLLDKLYTTPLSQYWWHAQDATLNNLHNNQEAKEASSHTLSTTLGITNEIDFFGATYDSHNSLAGYTETNYIGGTIISEYTYSNIQYDSYGRQISYSVSGSIYGQSYTREYSNIKYDVLSRVIGYSMRETLDGETTEYTYWDMQYNDLWQLTNYHYSSVGIEHTITLTYNSYGLIATFSDSYFDEEGTAVTISRVNTYNENGLLTEYTEYELHQSDSVHEFYYTWVGNISYNSIYAISAFDNISIVDTDATEISDYSAKIPIINSALTFDGINYELTAIDMIALGFDYNFTIYTEKWRGLNYYSAGSSPGDNGHYLTVGDTFRGRIETGSKILRTTTLTSDTAEITTW